ncbi:MAG TPA: FtsX-like permease family protein [Myxococcaceae bacterium]|nr:FtsX-like permease family protein [Myxococcaceae bacterium]
MGGHLRILIRIALRNLFATKLNLIIGGIILVGTLLVVVGGALLDSMDQSMSRSIIGSVAGNIQVYSAKSKDELALYGAMGSEADLAAIDDFSKLKAALEMVPNVKTVVPMGINAALITSGNTVDIALEKMRDLVRQKLEGRASPDLEARYQSQKEYIRQILRVLQSDLKKREVLVTAKAIEPENLAALDRAASNAFWNGFDRDPLNSLEFLENKIAPQSSDADLIYLRYMGTDLDEFQKSFDRIEIVDGRAVPSGHRGFLFAKFFYENQLKLKAARRLDRIKKTVVDQGKLIVTSTGRGGQPSEAEHLLKQNQAQTQEIILQLDKIKSEQAIERLQRELGSTEKDLDTLLKHFFDMNDQNFTRRFNFFYEQLAPLLELYRIRVGDVLTIKAFTRSGYVQSVNVPVYGTFQFKGMEDAALAGSLNLMDLVSFRDLFGYLSADKIEEVNNLKKLAGAEAIDRSRAEEELFGTARKVVAEATPGLIDEGKESNASLRALRREELLRRVYSKDEMDNGVMLNAAVILKDPAKIKQTMKEIESLSEREKFNLKVVSWQTAAGLIGQFVSLAKLALYIAVFIIFIVALVIINNAMMMATMQRVHEIGTMRAIGAQRSFVLGLVLTEIIVLGLVFGATGAAIGTGVVKWLGRVGIAAPNDWFYFFFSGPRLHPWLTAANLIAAFVIVLLVSAISTLYPAFLATRVAPVRAMQAEE